MKNYKRLRMTAILLAAMSIAHAAFGQSPPPQTNSVKSSKSSDMAADQLSEAPQITRLIGACAAAADELAKTRSLVDALERENRATKERLETEKRTTAIMQELIDTQHQEANALRTAMNAENEVIAAKDVVIDSQGKLIETLKKKRGSPWRRLGDVLIGAALFAILK